MLCLFLLACLVSANKLLSADSSACVSGELFFPHYPPQHNTASLLTIINDSMCCLPASGSGMLVWVLSKSRQGLRKSDTSFCQFLPLPETNAFPPTVGNQLQRPDIAVFIQISVTDKRDVNVCVGWGESGVRVGKVDDSIEGLKRKCFCKNSFRPLSSCLSFGRCRPTTLFSCHLRYRKRSGTKFKNNMVCVSVIL